MCVENMEYSDWQIRVVWQLYDNVQGVVFIRMTPLLMAAQFTSIVQMSIWILTWSLMSLICDDSDHWLMICKYIFYPWCLFVVPLQCCFMRCQYIMREYSIWSLLPGNYYPWSCSLHAGKSCKRVHAWHSCRYNRTASFRTTCVNRNSFSGIIVCKLDKWSNYWRHSCCNCASVVICTLWIVLLVQNSFFLLLISATFRMTRNSNKVLFLFKI